MSPCLCLQHEPFACSVQYLGRHWNGTVARAYTIYDGTRISCVWLRSRLSTFTHRTHAWQKKAETRAKGKVAAKRCARHSMNAQRNEFYTFYYWKTQRHYEIERTRILWHHILFFIRYCAVAAAVSVHIDFFYFFFMSLLYFDAREYCDIYELP